MQPQLNEAQVADINERREAFKKEYEELCRKYSVEIMTAPNFVPTPDGTFGLVIAADFVDLKYRVPSPLKAGM